MLHFCRAISEKYLLNENCNCSQLLILTPNRRLVGFVHQQLDRYHRFQLRRNFWERPTIFAFSNWLKEIWNNSQNSTVLLSAAQERALWEKIIVDVGINIDADDGSTFDILSLTSGKISPLVDQAMAAWRLLRNWKVSLEQLSRYSLNDEMRSFYQWAHKFTVTLADHNWCTTSDLPHLIIQGLLCQLNQESEKSAVSKTLNPFAILPHHLLLVGFEQLTLSPQEQALLGVVQQLGCNIEYLDPNQNEPQVNRQTCLVFNKPDEEIYAMARWAYQRWLAQPDSDIGCIVPDLHVRRDEVARIFTEVFTVAAITTLLGKETNQEERTIKKDDLSHQVQQRNVAFSFNISVGKLLASYPVVDAALTLLGLGRESLSIDEWQKIFTTPFLKDYWLNPTVGAIAWEEIKTLTAYTRNDYLSCATVLSVLKKIDPQLTQVISNYRDALVQFQRLSQSLRSWGKFFAEQLQRLGWPGTRQPNSSEYQTLQCWHELLIDEFSSLDLIMSPVLSYKTALDKLTNLARQKIFQPQQTQHTTPQHVEVDSVDHDLNKFFNCGANINILGVLEAAGLNFDYLWVMGMNDQNWPLSPKPNIFLPIVLQKQMNMPNSSTTRELEFCREITTRWERSARRIVYSYTQQQDDGVVVNLSPLLSHVAVITDYKDELELNSKFEHKLNEILWQSGKDYLESYLDNSAPSVGIDEKTRGGSGILKSQAQCPFQAFAKYRLQALTKLSGDSGIKILRGNIIHYALERIWQLIQDRNQLLKNNKDELQKIINNAIEFGISRIKSDRRQNKSLVYLPEHHLDLEKTCLQRLLWQWLELEKKREFFKVIAIEKEIELNLGRLPLRLRVDRIDELASGKRIIIDYKTGKEMPRLRDCLEVPPSAPQLPLYYVALADRDVVALLFAHVNLESHKPFYGINICNEYLFSSQPGLGMWKDVDGQQMCGDWLHSLLTLANDFMNGVVAIAPRRREDCDRCGLLGICRRGELHLSKFKMHLT